MNTHKKQYQAPTTEEILLEVEQVIAVSPGAIKDVNVDDTPTTPPSGGGFWGN